VDWEWVQDQAFSLVDPPRSVQIRPDPHFPLSFPVLDMLPLYTPPDRKNTQVQGISTTKWRCYVAFFWS
jgi:hypothetical protein